MHSFKDLEIARKLDKPTVTFAAEILGMRMEERQYLHIMEMKCLRSMNGVTRVKSEVRCEVGVMMKMSERFDWKLLKNFGEKRMSGDRLTERVYESKVEGKRDRRRPWP